jgi:spore germination protein GerM
LSWGPAGNELAAAGMDSALPRPETMAESPQFQNGWAARVYLQSIKISDGTATVDWSPEMAAWGGGSARLAMLRQQVEATLGQFPTIKNVVMTVNGSEEVLQP